MKSKQSIFMLLVGVLLYLFDCHLNCMKHPEVAWIQSGRYAGPGFLFDIGFVPVGIYGLATHRE